ncbi:hypothetical protein V6N11_029010 [Hibiscus sabdariffa]|uniref:Uncharacterized protein n=1 Tax=Hibiscus sabdariffa TaxID=183260 RepID=A0ABR2NWF1_9ROSI
METENGSTPTSEPVTSGGAEWFWKEGQKTGSKAAIADNVQESVEMEPIHGQQNEGAAVGDEDQSYNETRAEGPINDQGSRESDRLGESSSTNEVLGTVDIDNTVHDSVHSSKSTHGICVEDTPVSHQQQSGLPNSHQQFDHEDITVDGNIPFDIPAVLKSMLPR